ncbi:MAG TPA: amino acid ABC transporter permease [Casimicrobiaceae bacterium]|nr:amino acid ABC transporter permease [Casimicrobiaceae bacterium]
MNVLVDNFGYILSGAGATVRLAALASVLMVAVGAIAGLLRLYAPLPIRLLSVAYIELFRGTPVLVQMFFIFFGLPLLGWNPSAFTAATVALVLNNGAYLAEIVRGGVQAISREQWSAGLALGLKFRQVLASVVIPQALRRIIPPAVGQFTILVKDTSIASAIGFFEMTRAGQHVVERTLASFEIFTLVGALFFAICYAGSWLSRRLEKRLSRAAPSGESEWRYILGAR